MPGALGPATPNWELGLLQFCICACGHLNFPLDAACCLQGLLGNRQRPIFFLRTRPYQLPRAWNRHESQAHKSQSRYTGLSLPWPFSSRRLASFCHMVAICSMVAFRGSQATSAVSVMPVTLVFRCLDQGLRVVLNPNDSETPSDDFSKAFLRSHLCSPNPLSSLSPSVYCPMVSWKSPLYLLLLQQCLVPSEGKRSWMHLGHGVLEGSNRSHFCYGLVQVPRSRISWRLCWLSPCYLPVSEPGAGCGGSRRGPGMYFRTGLWSEEAKNARAFCKEVFS